ncbi:hypothetical protein EDB87DRAFT_1576242 [Lactarius vividus]|nr:hypothetical protein EDB87DRAFT_1576242 [Lactarius vividus]
MATYGLGSQRSEIPQKGWEGVGTNEIDNRHGGEELEMKLLALLFSFHDSGGRIGPVQAIFSPPGSGSGSQCKYSGVITSCVETKVVVGVKGLTCAHLRVQRVCSSQRAGTAGTTGSWSSLTWDTGGCRVSLRRQRRAHTVQASNWRALVCLAARQANCSLERYTPYLQRSRETVRSREEGLLAAGLLHVIFGSKLKNAHQSTVTLGIPLAFTLNRLPVSLVTARECRVFVRNPTTEGSSIFVGGATTSTPSIPTLAVNWAVSPEEEIVMGDSGVVGCPNSDGAGTNAGNVQMTRAATIIEVGGPGTFRHYYLLGWS